MSDEGMEQRNMNPNIVQYATESDIRKTARIANRAFRFKDSHIDIPVPVGDAVMT